MKIYVQRGFTIIEVMIAIALLSVLIVIGVPAFTSTINSNETVAKSNSFLSALKIARSEATKRRQNVIVCASNTQSNCTSSANKWADGWIVFVDTDTSNTFSVGDSIITTLDMPDGYTVARAASGADQIRFSATGLSDSTLAQTFTFCKASTPSGRQFTVERSGLVTGASVNCP